MRYLLIQSYLGRSEQPVYPLGIVFLGSVLEQQKEHEVQCLDLNVQIEPYQDLIKTINEFQPEVVGLSLRNIDTTQTRDLFYYYLSFREQVNIIKKQAPNSLLIAGGAGFSLYAERIMQDNPAIDVGIYREGEATLLELSSSLQDLSDVKGLYYRKNGILHFSGERNKMDLALLPQVHWDLVKLQPYRNHPGCIGVETKRGCCLSCDYCTYPFLDGTMIRKHSSETLIASLKDLSFNHGINNFTFVDSVFNVPRDHASEICNRIIEEQIPLHWVGWFNERHLDKTFVELCIEAGCVEFSFSPDGFSDRTLKKLKKNISTKNIHDTFQLAKSIPTMNVSYNFLANPPGQDTLSFFKLFFFLFKSKFRFKNRLKGFCITNLRIEPNTGIYQRSLKEKVIDEQTDLLPEDVKELRKLFYTNPRTGYLNPFMRIYALLWSIRAWLKQRITH